MKPTVIHYDIIEPNDCEQFDAWVVNKHPARVVVKTKRDGHEGSLTRLCRLLLCVCLVFLTLGYLLPTAIAVDKQRKNIAAIFTLNLLLGWTFVFWVFSLVWALKDEKTF